MPSTGLWASSPIGSAISSRPAVELGAIGHELPCDRVARIGGIDQLGDVGRQRQRVAGGDRFDLGAALARDEPGRDQVIGACAASGVLISWPMSCCEVWRSPAQMLREPAKSQSTSGTLLARPSHATLTHRHAGGGPVALRTRRKSVLECADIT